MSTKESLPPPIAVDTAKFFDGTIESIDRSTSTIVLKAKTGGTKHAVHYRDDTLFKSLLGASRSLDDFREEYPDSLPFAVGDKVHVTWKPSTSKKRTIAVSIAPILE
jgi:hypothetical protein